MTEAVIIIDWFLYDNGLRHERVLTFIYVLPGKVV